MSFVVKFLFAVFALAAAMAAPNPHLPDAINRLLNAVLYCGAAFWVISATLEDFNRK